MLKNVSLWILPFMLLMEGVYMSVLLKRIGYGDYKTNLACDTVAIVYVLCFTTFAISTRLFFRTKPISYVYTFYTVTSLVMLIVFVIMTYTEKVVGIGDGIEGGLFNFLCPHT
jgi:bacteriorhodopsin